MIITLFVAFVLGVICLGNWMDNSVGKSSSSTSDSLPRWRVVDHELRCPHGQAVVCRDCGIISDMLHEIHMGISCETCELLLNEYFREPLPATIEEVYLQKLNGDDLVGWGRDVIDKAVLEIDHPVDDALAHLLKQSFNQTEEEEYVLTTKRRWA